MNFIKTFGNYGKSFRASVGSAILKDGRIRIRLPNTVAVKEKGFIEGGIGVVTEPKKAGKSAYTLLQCNIDKDYLPPELQGTAYRYFIPAEQISENEYVFLYKRTRILNKK